MSRTDDEPRETWFLWSRSPVSDARQLLGSILAFFERVGVRPAQMRVVSSPAKIKRAKFARAAAMTAVGDPQTRRIVLSSEGDSPAVEVEAYLQDREDLEHGPRHRVFKVLTRPGLGDPGAALEVVAAATRHYDIAHGGAMVCGDRPTAMAEVNLIGSADVASDTAARVDFDAMHTDEAQRRLRRLYPITIIGPAIWAELTPLPADLAHARSVADLGNCKLLTAWPELCGARDPAFLRGTVALRTWLWPHTIQNPADHVDEDPYDYGAR